MRRNHYLIPDTKTKQIRFSIFIFMVLSQMLKTIICIIGQTF